MLTTPSDRLLSISLALHVHSPSVQMFQQVILTFIVDHTPYPSHSLQVSSEVYVSLGREDCSDGFVSINEGVVCDIEELGRELEKVGNE